MYNIEWKESVLKDLQKLDKSIASRIYKKVGELSKDPSSKDIQKLRGFDSYRLRIGDYRVIFDIEKNNIIILKVGHRKNIYYK